MPRQTDLYTRGIIVVYMPTRTVTESKKALLDAMETIDDKDSATAEEVSMHKGYGHDTALAALKFLEMKGMVRREHGRGARFYKVPEEWLGVQ